MIEIMNKLLARAQKQLTQEMGREPTPEEIAGRNAHARLAHPFVAQDGTAAGFLLYAPLAMKVMSASAISSKTSPRKTRRTSRATAC